MNTISIPDGPVMLAAFEGWNDAGDAASETIDYLCNLWDAEDLTELDPEEYYDFQVNRPQVSPDGTGSQVIEWPTTTLFKAKTGAGRDVILISGIEPSMRWKSYCRELLAIASDHGVKTLVTIGAMLADVPHTRPVPISVGASDPQLRDELGGEPSSYEGPTGIVGVLQNGAAQIMSTVSLWAAVPHYVAQPPMPRATIALIGKIEEVLGEPISLGHLPEDAAAWMHGADELSASDDEIAEYVQHLESTQDAISMPEASGEAIAKEFEKYLQRRGEDPGPGKGQDGPAGPQIPPASPPTNQG